MKQTFFMIPSSWFDGPLLIGWLILGLIIMTFLYFRHGTKELVGFLPMYALFAAVIYFLLPRIQVSGLNPEDPSGALINAGLAIRGWGFCLLLAMASAVGLLYIRCKQLDFDFDSILSLAFWMIVIGIAGARLFYIIQKWDQFAATNLNDLITKLLDATKGGMVVYGSLIGGMVGAAVYFWISKIDWRKSLDIVAPAMVLGLAIGRIGCLMNGCCYGGVCDSQFGIEFPAGSPPYFHQLYHGQLIGIQGEMDEENRYPLLVKSVEPNSIAATDEFKIEPGDRLNIQPNNDPLYFRGVHQKNLDIDKRSIVINFAGDKKNTVEIPIKNLPSSSLKVHPTQIYSAIAAALLAAFLWLYFPFRKFDGEVFAILLIIYPIARFILEAIRVDEGGQLNTTLTISQWISMVTVLLGFALWAWARNNETFGNRPGSPATP